ncbi:Enoyl-[acyl-carrier-protein] reductase [FMN] [hydrothermal vent metagenome]|uniref:Enoyl-[acyl-carrier-protein] reductase [FMN] n=1 Tax=hydrothermal vent metagenome TaxID=652676 RepID=A0A3B1BBZ8_9ZZZZ
MNQVEPNPFLDHLGIKVPAICGPMYPCSNPELVAAVSKAGGIGIVQPISLTYVHGYDFRQGLRHIRSLTDKPIGMNALIEKSSRRYHQRMQQWIEIALEEGVRFFITSLGNPRWVVEQVHQAGGLVYHDATERKWAIKGVEAGVDGLIAVNNRAGGHAGGLTPHGLYDALSDLGLPLICAGGVGGGEGFKQMMDIGYNGVQMGTAFIATQECQVSEDYKQAIIQATEADIVLTERLTGVPVSVIRNSHVDDVGLKNNALSRWLLGHAKTKGVMRMLLALCSFRQLKKDMALTEGKETYWQAGKSVGAVKRIRSAAEIIAELEASVNDSVRCQR